MTTDSEKAPIWFDDAVVMRASGMGCREIARNLKIERDIEVSHTAVWFWVTKTGRETRRRMMSPEARQRAREYQRARKQGIRQQPRGA